MQFEEKLNEIFIKTGDSILKDYIISNGMIKIELELDDGSYIFLTFQTNMAYFDKIDADKNEHKNIGFMEYKKLENILKMENNYYVNYENEFKKIMKLTKNKYHLALGLKNDEANYIIYFHGYDIKIAFIVKENSEIIIERNE